MTPAVNLVKGSQGTATTQKQKQNKHPAGATTAGATKLEGIQSHQNTWAKPKQHLVNGMNSVTSIKYQHPITPAHKLDVQ